MKKILAVLLLLASLVCIFACSDDEKFYEPVESTEEEKQVVMAFNFDGKSYEVKYELYRALFLNFSYEYDGGDKSFWDSEGSSAALASVNEKIVDYAADIYSTLHVAEKIGFNPYSESVNTEIKRYVKKSVDGYADEDEFFVGFGGDYNKYLAHLESLNMNYSVQELLIRYEIAKNAVNSHYAGTVDAENPTEDMKNGALEYSEADVKAFYDGDASSRVLLAQLDSRSYSKERAEEIRAKIDSFTDVQSVKNYIVGFTATAEKDVFDGVVIGKYSLDSAYYSDVTEAAFALEHMQTSEVISVVTGSGSYYYILYKVDKSDEHYAENAKDIENVYVADRIGAVFAEWKINMKATTSYTELFGAIKHSEISIK